MRRFIRAAYFFCVFSSMCGGLSLDQIALKHGTDKSSGYREGDGAYGHYYTRYYEKYFEGLRDKSIRLLEVGFYHGSSARMWEEYFPRANLYFVDINENFFRVYGNNLSERCKMYVANQGSESSLRQFLSEAGGDFDIIIDDGSHKNKHQIISFETLFPCLKPGGVYVIEDLHTSYWALYEGGGSPEVPKANSSSAIRFLQALVDSVNFIGARTTCADENKCPDRIRGELTYYQQHIQSIHFYGCICFIFKR